MMRMVFRGVVVKRVSLGVTVKQTLTNVQAILVSMEVSVLMELMATLVLVHQDGLATTVKPM